MILNNHDIINAKNNGSIIIDPWKIDNLNSNSYNLTLHNKLLVYDETILDPKRINKTKETIIPEEGLILYPNKLYLGRTVEYTATYNFVPGIEGRSSFGRLGLHVHVSAGFGDIGFCGHWTLEICCVEPIIIYPFLEICQIFYHTTNDYFIPYSGKYQNQGDIVPSLIYKELT